MYVFPIRILVGRVVYKSHGITGGDQYSKIIVSVSTRQIQQEKHETAILTNGRFNERDANGFRQEFKHTRTALNKCKNRHTPGGYRFFSLLPQQL